MENIKLIIDGKECPGQAGETILDVAKRNGIEIPTLCYDDRVEIYGACGICAVEVEGNPKMVKACATMIAPDMVVNTRTERVLESRKTNLELLLSNHRGDCRPPCVLNCPAGTDCQGYVGLIANGQYRESVKLIKERIPLPGSIGRVCPHPCEDNCRRQLVDEPVSIAWLKRFAADMEGDDPYIPPVAKDTGKKVAIIGGGPFGLSLAYYLRQKGHGVTIFESMPHFGGMLRYGIPQYRLPKEVVDGEVAQMEKMGIVLKPNTHVGKDISFEEIKNGFNAVALGVGAWVSTGTGCPGEDAKGVYGGIDFLRKVIKKEEIELGDTVAVVGGGNTAMDACRTAVRLGKKVYNIYRRTKDEMPADLIEIEEAEEEGVIFRNLTNPLEIIKDEKGRVRQIKLQIMELGEPDASGRRAPVPIEGKTEILDVDNVILAIGQAVEYSGLEGFDMTRKKGFVYDPETFMTSMEGVFAGGDCGNDKISIAVEAIADGVKAAEIIHSYLSGEKIRYRKPYVVQRHDIDEKTFEDRERYCRPKMGMMNPEDRKDNFKEIVAGYPPADAEYEGGRCLECGCGKYFECKLYKYSNQYDVKPERIAGDINHLDFDDNHPYVVRDPDKCILCGLCVRVCHEAMGVTALGLVRRGFETTVQPALGNPLKESGCINCGNCISLCPVGALLPKVEHTKPIPLDTTPLRTTCTECGVGCQMDLKLSGTKVVGTEPAFGPSNAGLLCVKGKYGYRKLYTKNRLTTPLVRKDGGLEEATWEEALNLIASKLSEIKYRRELDAFAAFAGHMVSNEAKFMLNKLMTAVTGKKAKWQETAVMADPSTDQGRGADAILKASGAKPAAGAAIESMRDDKVHSALETGKVRILYLMGDNPLDPEKRVDGIEDALKKCELIIVQDIALNEAAKIADVVLPADSFAEADGTFTNMEGRVQRIRKAAQGPGEALADAKIISLLLSRLGEDTGYRSAKDVFDAICGEVPGYGDMSYEALETEGSMLIK